MVIRAIPKILLQNLQKFAATNNDSITNIWEIFFNKYNPEQILIDSNNKNLTNNFEQNEIIIRNLKKLYKDCSFETIQNEETNSSVIKVYDKNNNFRAEIIIDNNKQIRIKEDYDSETQSFNSVKIYDGKVKQHFVNNNGIWNQVKSQDFLSCNTENDTYPVSQIVDDLYQDNYTKTNYYSQKNVKKLKEDIKKINKDNVLEVLQGFYEKSGEDKKSLVSSILENKWLYPNDIAEILLHIENCLLDKYESMGVYVEDIRKDIQKEIQHQKNSLGEVRNGKFLDKLNDKLNRRLKGKLMGQNIKEADGKINEISYQGRTGDCWLLAAINSIVRTPKGKEILENSIKVNNDGSVTVHLKGVNKTYTFSKEELHGATELATGDMDVRALEMAVERYMMETEFDDIVGDYPSRAYKILLGKKNISKYDDSYPISDDIIKHINDENVICNVWFSDANTEKTGEIAFITSNGTPIYKNHAYSPIRSDEKYVYVKNPWNSAEEIPLTHDEFKRFNQQETIYLK